MSKNIYTKKLMELWRNPKNFKEIDNPTHEYVEVNDICGDDLSLQMIVEDGIIKDAAFLGTGCLVCIVSASELTEKIKGMKVEDVKNLTDDQVFEMIDIDFPRGKGICAGLALRGVKNCLDSKE